jgi:cytochrome c biogenesis protein CcmG/thiol:disulfide interchange protein DsbE
VHRRALTVAAIVSGTVLVVSLVLFGRTHGESLNQAAMINPLAPKTGDLAPAPDFRAQTLDGRAVSLADYRGRTVVVNFFAAWCTPCAEEAPALASFAASRGKGVVMLSIARASSRSGARAFARSHGMDWTVLFDGNDALTRAFRLFGQPATFVIDGRGRIVFSKLGPISERMLAAAVRSA